MTLRHPRIRVPVPPGPPRDKVDGWAENSAFWQIIRDKQEKAAGIIQSLLSAIRSNQVEDLYRNGWFSRNPFGPRPLTPDWVIAAFPVVDDERKFFQWNDDSAEELLSLPGWETHEETTDFMTEWWDTSNDDLKEYIDAAELESAAEPQRSEWQREVYMCNELVDADMVLATFKDETASISWSEWETDVATLKRMLHAPGWERVRCTLEQRRDEEDLSPDLVRLYEKKLRAMPE